MSDFDKDEWLEENNVRPGDDWVSLRGKKPKQEFCDIRLQDGREIGPCWTRDNDFIDLSSDTEDTYAFSAATHVRYYEDGATSGPSDEDDEGDDDET